MHAVVHCSFHIDDNIIRTCSWLVAKSVKNISYSVTIRYQGFKELRSSDHHSIAQIYYLIAWLWMNYHYYKHYYLWKYSRHQRPLHSFLQQLPAGYIWKQTLRFIVVANMSGGPFRSHQWHHSASFTCSTTSVLTFVRVSYILVLLWFVCVFLISGITSRSTTWL